MCTLKRERTFPNSHSCMRKNFKGAKSTLNFERVHQLKSLKEATPSIFGH